MIRQKSEMKILFQTLSVLVLDIVLIALIKYVHGAHTKLENVFNGKRLEGFLFVSYYGNDIHDCVDKCARKVHCKSLNYHKGVMMCELNTRGAAIGSEAPPGDMLQTKDGFSYVEYKEWSKRTSVSCGENTCTDRQTCTSDKLTCHIKECEVPLPPTNGVVLGNRVESGSKILIGCKIGSVDTNTWFSSECDGMFWDPALPGDDFCKPATCKRIAENQTNPVSGEYTYFDTGSQELVKIYCLFDHSEKHDYTYISPDSLQHLNHLSNHYTETDHVLIRHMRSNGDQQEAKISLLESFASSLNLSFLLNKYDGYFEAVQFQNWGTTQYIYIGLVPKTNAAWQTDPRTQMGYSCNGVDKLFTPSDENYNNYFAVFVDPVTAHQNPCNTPPCTQAAGEPWVGACDFKLAFLNNPCATNVNVKALLPENYFYSQYIMEMGGGGACLQQNDDNTKAIEGMTVGFKFTF